jgi:hypothetical protein
MPLIVQFSRQIHDSALLHKKRAAALSMKPGFLFKLRLQNAEKQKTELQI